MERSIPKITDGEMRILEVLWEKGTISASEIVSVLNEQISWNRNTTYTFINRLVEKDAVKREDPGFICTPLYTKDEVLISESNNFLNKVYHGSLNLMVSRFIENKALSRKELDELKDLIEKSIQ